jgi:hypothetical protein
MNLWSRVVTTRIHYQMGALSRPAYIELLGVYHKIAVRQQLEALR